MTLFSEKKNFSPDGTGNSAMLGDLPEWNFDDLYPGEKSPELKKDLNWLANETASFEEDYKGKLAEADPDSFLKIINRYEAIQNVAGRIMSFAGLKYQQLTTDPDRATFLADMQDKVTDASAHLIFFTLELNSMDEDVLQSILQSNADLSRYITYFGRIRALKPHQLSDELESFLHDQSVVGTNAWIRLFDETMAGLTMNVDGQSMGLEETLNLLTDTEQSTRKSSYDALSSTFAANLPLFARITNTLAKEKEIEDRWRNLPTPQASRHLSNHVEAEVVDAMTTAVVSAYPETSHRYYALKAKWMGQEKLNLWDRNAPLPEAEETLINWERAQSIVLDAYHDFDPRIAELTKQFFNSGWIDAGVKEGKAPGAFAHPTVTNVHPYVMLNYMGKPRDVMTLAHELGHGVHQLLAANQGELLSSTPLTLAETASVFGEMLVFRKLLSETTDAASRKILLAGKVEDMINTVCRQISFYEFESKLHSARANGELTSDEIGSIWLETQKSCLGDVFNFDENYHSFWTYIPHFIHSPFYVYAYSFGDCLVNALYAAFENEPEGFQDKYEILLKAGGSRHHSDLLTPFGLDARKPEFWSNGLNLLTSMIDELEEISG